MLWGKGGAARRGVSFDYDSDIDPSFLQRGIGQRGEGKDLSGEGAAGKGARPARPILMSPSH